MFDFKNREIVEMMYLICTRCMSNIAPINFEYEKRKNNLHLLNLLKNVTLLYKKITERWMHYSQ
jgi:hypothetical protein